MLVINPSDFHSFAVQADTEAGVPGPGAEMQTFYAKVQEIREKMEQMSEGQKKLISLHEASKTAVQVDKTRRIRDQMASVTDQVLQQAKLVKNDVEYLEKANAEAIRKVHCFRCQGMEIRVLDRGFCCMRRFAA
jgi:hypothetical protein